MIVAGPGSGKVLFSPSFFNCEWKIQFVFLFVVGAEFSVFDTRLPRWLGEFWSCLVRYCPFLASNHVDINHMFISLLFIFHFLSIKILLMMLLFLSSCFLRLLYFYAIYICLFIISSWYWFFFSFSIHWITSGHQSNKYTCNDFHNCSSFWDERSHWRRDWEDNS